MNPEYIDDGKGGKVLAFMQNGTPMRNPDTNLNPYTASELVIKELREMGVLEVPRKQTGTGSQTTITVQNGGTIDLSGARTQNEAHEIIAKALLAQGLTLASAEFQKQKDKIWKENISVLKTLPIR